MEIIISGHHVEVTEALRTFTEEKLETLKKFDETITRIEVTLIVDKKSQKAEANVHVPHTNFHAEHTTHDLYSAIDGLREKLSTQIKKHHEKIKKPRRDIPTETLE